MYVFLIEFFNSKITLPAVLTYLLTYLLHGAESF